MIKQSQQNFAHLTTVLLSWGVQNFIVIGQICYEQEHYKIWLNFEFNQNIICGWMNFGFGQIFLSKYIIYWNMLYFGSQACENFQICWSLRVKIYLYMFTHFSEKSKRRTKTVAGSLEPKWNQTFIYSAMKRVDIQSRALEVTVYDYDRIGSGEYVGEVSITVTTRWHHAVSHHWQISCLFNSFFRLTTKEILRLCIAFWCRNFFRGISCEISLRWISWHILMKSQHWFRCNDLALNRWQTITWTRAGPFHW